jgi:hypothetical protein
MIFRAFLVDLQSISMTRGALLRLPSLSRPILFLSLEFVFVHNFLHLIGFSGQPPLWEIHISNLAGSGVTADEDQALTRHCAGSQGR